jgi:hypothetical protein
MTTSLSANAVKTWTKLEINNNPARGDHGIFGIYAL